MRPPYAVAKFCRISWSPVYLSINYVEHHHPYPDSKVHGANMGPTWVLSAPDGPHVGLSNLAIRVPLSCAKSTKLHCSCHHSYLEIGHYAACHHSCAEMGPYIHHFGLAAQVACKAAHTFKSHHMLTKRIMVCRLPIYGWPITIQARWEPEVHPFTLNAFFSLSEIRFKLARRTWIAPVYQASLFSLRTLIYFVNNNLLCVYIS